MKTFYQLLANALIVVTKNNFVWFGLTYWLYLQTHSVVATSVMGGVYLLAASLSGLILGAIVDNTNKKTAILGSGIFTFVLFLLGLGVLVSSPETAFTTVASVHLWILIVLLLLGVISGSIMNIAVPVLVTHIVPEEERDKANGLFGTIMGISFTITSVASGIVLAYAGMFWVLMISLILTVVSLIHLWLTSLPKVTHQDQPEKDTTSETKGMDIKGTIAAITSIPGLLALILFTTFNNFLGGVFMSLMDAYGLSLVSVQVWGMLWGVLSLGFILGGLYIAKKGLGKNPLKKLFHINLVTWTVCIFFTIQPSIILLAIGIFIWMALVPFIEATEQTIIQKVVPANRQGRVFGFAHSVEQAASPLTAFFIGPITQYIFIPFMSTGRGVELIGDWFGVGPGRGIALVFTITGVIGFIVTQFAMRSKPYQLLAKRYES